MENGNSHSAIDNLIGMNDLKQLWESIKGKNVLGQEVSPVTEENMLDIAMSVTPMGASIRGGKVAKPILDQLLGLSKKLGIKQSASSFSRNLPETVQDYTFRNKLNAARLQKQKVLDKLQMEDPDRIFRGFSKN